ncbi:GPI mannosyltransferase 2 [Vararia minispora EC-137]|uniref:GPI mannosyltransferase 2 n=1 Tax=Vararia minispora EC-137 TaxID=1314806 RepID=A0ACB8QZB3_9AGAM|nr:GPI mannosyltransferase 2 [Vararia minispora EC-137]
MTSQQAQHLRLIFWASISAHATVASFIYVSTFLPTFDSSASAVLPSDTPRLLSALLRWDVFHFVAAALDRRYEHQWAFLPGLPAVMRIAPRTSALQGPLAAGALGALACSTLAPRALYALSLHHLKSPRLALLASLLWLVPASPATLLFAPYAEAYFALFSFQGMLECTKKRYVRAAAMFALATAFRANGVLLAGYILYDLVAQPVLLSRCVPPLASMLKAAVLSAVVLTPFIWHQYTAYRLFCASDAGPGLPPWCADAIPSVYTYVQSKYWNNGFLRYWTPAQLPNILLAAPLLTLLLTFSLSHLMHFLPDLLRTPQAAPRAPTPFLSASLAPYAIHTLILSLVLLLASHTQIALRLASALPTTSWAAARLLVERPRVGRAWITWGVGWGAVSVVLWTTFLPPA